MPRPKGSGKKTRDLVGKLDEEAMALLSLPRDKMALEMRLVIFGSVSRWAVGRNKTGETDEQEDLLGAYRRSIETASAAVERAGAGKRHTTGEPITGKFTADFSGQSGGDSYNGGEALEALKSRLPGADDGHTDGDSSGGGGENPVIAGANRLVRPSLSGHDAIDFDEPYSDGDV